MQKYFKYKYKYKYFKYLYFKYSPTLRFTHTIFIAFILFLYFCAVALQQFQATASP